MEGFIRIWHALEENPLEDIAVEEQQGVEGLVLSRCGHAGNGQPGEEGFDLRFRREG